MISIVVVTYNRLKLLKLCVDQVLMKTSDATMEIVIWNNASTDGTKEYLNTIKDKRFRIVNHTKNIGTNAKARANKLAKAHYLISLDDDVIEAPENWDKTLLDAFLKMPSIGFLAANIIDDGKGTHANYMYRERDLEFAETTVINGVEVVLGWAGAWCAITSRELYDRVGGFQENPKFVFWNEDDAYRHDLRQIGYDSCLLKSLKVFHAAGPYYVHDENIQRAKKKYYTYIYKQRKKQKFKTAIKKRLDKISFIRRLNARHQFYQLPKER